MRREQSGGLESLSAQERAEQRRIRESEEQRLFAREEAATEREFNASQFATQFGLQKEQLENQKYQFEKGFGLQEKQFEEDKTRFEKQFTLLTEQEKRNQIEFEQNLIDNTISRSAEMLQRGMQGTYIVSAIDYVLKSGAVLSPESRQRLVGYRDYTQEQHNLAVEKAEREKAEREKPFRDKMLGR